MRICSGEEEGEMIDGKGVEWGLLYGIAAHTVGHAHAAHAFDPGVSIRGKTCVRFSGGADNFYGAL